MCKITSDSTVVASDGQVSSRVSDEEVILNLENGEYYGLNPVGAKVWMLIQKPIIVSDLVNQLTSEYDVDRERCMNDVLSLLKEMNEEGLVRCVDKK
jgi:hypothetical protein